MYNITIINKSGLTACGKNEEGEQMYLGTEKQWEKAEELANAADQVADNAREDELLEKAEREQEEELIKKENERI